jgi:hypothetical protein
MPRANTFTPPPDSTETGDVRHAFLKVWKGVEPAMERCVLLLTEDPDERKDLLQEARFALFDMEATRCNPASEKDLAALARVLMDVMIVEAKKSRGEMSFVVPVEVRRLYGHVDDALER